MVHQSFKNYLNLFKVAWDIFKENHPVKFASAFAYFSLFGLPSILVITIFILSFIFDPAILFNELNSQLTSVVGKDSAAIMVKITSNYMEEAGEDLFNLVFYVGAVFLLATQLMVFFQDIINDLWKIKPNFKNIWQKLGTERGLASLMVIITGSLFFASAAIERMLESVGGGWMNEQVENILVNTITAILVFFWFALLYKLLPFVKIKWEPTLVGAAVTSVLFFTGTWILHEYVVKDQGLEDIYDYVAPIILISFWIFYNSLAFLYGACLTRAYAEFTDKQIEAKSYAYRFEIVEKED